MHMPHVSAREGEGRFQRISLYFQPHGSRARDADKRGAFDKAHGRLTTGTTERDGVRHERVAALFKKL